MILPNLALLVLAGAVHHHVVIVGVNTSVDPRVAPLSYADDDAARYAELFAGADGAGASSMKVLSVLDAETQRLFPGVAGLARAPSVSEFHAAISETFDAIKRDRDAGADTDFILILVGHGGVDENGEGYVSLVDGKITRSELIETVVAPSPARFNHIIVDACDAYAVLYRDASAVAAVRKLLESRSLSHYPNTGVLLATTSARETHEWSRVRGGVFSHEVLAALSGAADVDGDGSISYPEVGAFIEAANAGVKDARAHVDFTLQAPPLFLARPLTSTPKAKRSLAFAAKDAGHFTIEDARGVTVVEVNKSAEQPLLVALTGPPPFRVVRGRDEWVADVDGRASFASLPRANNGAATDRVAARGAVSDALDEGLFTVPFGKAYVAGYSAGLAHDSTMSPAGVSGASAALAAAAAHSSGAGNDAAPFQPGNTATGTAGFPWAGAGFTAVGGALVLGAVVAGGLGVGSLAQLDDGKGKLDAFAAQSLADTTNTELFASAVLAGGGVIASVVGFVMLASPP